MEYLEKYKIRITGYAGSGKSYFCEKLQALGYRAFDADSIPELSMWVDKKTLQPDDINSNSDADWLKNHMWVWDKKYLKKFLDHEDKVILMGMCRNEQDEEISGLFDHTFYLDPADADIVNGLKSEFRTNYFGKEKYQFDYAIQELPSYKKQIPRNWVALKTRDDAMALVNEIEGISGYMLEQ